MTEHVRFMHGPARNRMYGTSGHRRARGSWALGRRLGVVLAMVACGVLALGAGSAFAVLTYPFAGQLAPSGGSFGKLEAGSVAVDDSNGDTYVADSRSGVVDVFETATGTQLASLDGALTPARSFGRGQVEVAANDGTGDVYVLDSKDNVVDVFNSLGGYACQITGSATPSVSECNGAAGSRTPAGGFNGPGGIAVDQKTGEIYVVDAKNGVVDIFSAGGAYSGRQISLASIPGGFNATYTRGIAVDDFNGHVYVSDSGRDVVDEFNGAGGYVTTWTGANTPAESFGGGYVSVAADNANGDVYVTDSEHGVTDAFESSGAYVTRFSHSFRSPLGTAVDQASGRVYVSDDQLGVELAVVDIFDPAAFVPFVATGVASGVQPASATLHGGVNPEGVQVTDCHFDYGTSLAYGQIAACAETIGSGTTEVPVHADLSGLQPDTTYHFRLQASNANGTNPGLDETFTTPGPPTVDGESSSNITTATATLEAKIDPHGFDTTYHFEYGPTTAYGTSVPIPDADAGSGTTDQEVSAEIAALQVGTTYHFRVVATSSQGTVDGSDQTVATLPPAQIAEESASSITNHGATLNAQIDPDGLETTYHFEYGTSASYGASAPVPDGPVGSGFGSEPVSTEIIGLQAATIYHFRVVAVNAQGTVDGPDETFTTLPPALIDSASATNVAAESATLNARINPLGFATTYHFEWGASTSYGHSLPVPDAVVGSGGNDIAVSQQLTGLQPNTTYHYRVAATNSLGTARGLDHTFIYDTTGAGLPDNRAYEMVTPPQKNASLIGAAGGTPFDVSEDGSRVVWGASQCFAGARSCLGDRDMVGEPFAFTRTSGGWVTTSMAPPATQFAVNSAQQVSADAGTALFSIPTPPIGEDDFYARQPDGSFVHIGPETPGEAGPPTAPKDATADLSVVVFQSGAGGRIWPSFDATEGIYSLYEYAGSGNTAPVLVGVSGGLGSTDLISRCVTLLSEGVVGDQLSALSADGRTVYFTAGPCWSGSGANAGIAVPVYELFARVDRSRTVPISGHSPLGCSSVVCQGSPLAGAQFEGASEDGSKVFFTSTQQLTDNASEDSRSGDSAATAQGLDGVAGSGCAATSGVNGCNLYEYDFGAPAGRNLVAVSAGDTSGGGPRVRGVVAVSADGSHVYFTASGVLTGATNGQGQTAVDGADNLYVFERDASYPEGRISFITITGEIFRREVNVTPDGRFLVFTSGGRLTADDTSTTGMSQVFRYDAQTGTLIRISIGERGFNDNGNAGAGGARIVSVPLMRHNGPVRRDPSMSDDGSYVFFDSPVGLTPRALNDVQSSGGGYARNVYEWHEGQVYLISDGRDTSQTGSRFNSSVELLGSDASGADVFFTTADPLVAADTDTQRDVYDARVCTLSEPCVTAPPPVSPCEGEACHGASGAAPLAPVGATVSFSGPGNLAPPPVPVAKPKPKHKAKHRTKPKKRKPGRRSGRGKRNGHTKARSK